MSRFGSFAFLAVVVLASQAPAAATSAYFHLAQDGLCNKTAASVIFGVRIDCDSECGKCEMKTTTHFDGAGGGDLDPGECATATFYLETSGEACSIDLTFNVGDKSCEFSASIDPQSSEKKVEAGPCHSPLHATHGDEHFQITIE